MKAFFSECKKVSTHVQRGVCMCSEKTKNK